MLISDDLFSYILRHVFIINADICDMINIAFT